MSAEFSNADTGSKPADPYKAKNKDEPGTEEKIEALSNFISASKFGMMTTRIADSGLLVSRCMAVAAKVGGLSYLISASIPPRFSPEIALVSRTLFRMADSFSLLQENGGIDLIFHTNTESGKTSDIVSDPHVNISFLNGTGEWASISGSSDIITDRDVIHKYYSPALKAWVGDLGDGKHDGGPNDPRIGVIKVSMVTATYAISRGNFVTRGIDMVAGAVKGEAPQVNKLREISEAEVKSWRSKN
ncbi:MAG: hypothetical protein Q9160_002172 [Pyrenula sp. 1 TL-2023]